MRKALIFSALLILAIGVAFTSCSTSTGGSDSAMVGKLTITDIPNEAIGSYIAGYSRLTFSSDLYYTAKAPVYTDPFKLPGILITGNTVTLNVYEWSYFDEEVYSPYTGSDLVFPGYLSFLRIYKHTSADINFNYDNPQYTSAEEYQEKVQFLNGSATISYKNF